MFVKPSPGCCLLLLLLGLAGAAGAHTDPPADDSDARPVLGSISITVDSDSAAAREALVEGMLQLHVFEYGAARDAFRRARRHDPDLFMAYWGEAMTHNAPLWNRFDRPAARAVLAEWAPTPSARRARLDDPLRRGWLAALEALYGEGTKPERDRAHARVMKRMAAQYPDDNEVQLFYALALLGRHGGVRDHADYMRAAAIAMEVLTRQPRHPGAAHYLIHGVDDAVHAPLGLNAARQLAQTAPAAAHAQHMASHIFLALGMWEETATANERAIGVEERRRERPLGCGHYPVWYHYTLLQQGRHDAAARRLAACRVQAHGPGASFPARFELDPDESDFGSLVQMWARHLIDGRDWDHEIADWAPDPRHAVAPAMTLALVQALRGFDIDQPALVARAREDYSALHDQLKTELESRAGSNLMEQQYLRRADVIEAQIRALAAAVRDDGEAALAAARQAQKREMAMPAAFGPPFVDLPSAELLGELQLYFDRPQQAMETLTGALERTPGRSRTLYLLVRAAHASGARARARDAAGRLLDNWDVADAGWPPWPDMDSIHQAGRADY